MNIQLAAYYYPNYHLDARNESYHGKGWSEWELMKCARPRFPGHDQPKVPLWGYEDEANSSVMAKKIEAATTHGIDAFVFDWYWYDGPFLQRALDEGFLNAPNTSHLKFALMWANHDWRDRHPTGYMQAKNPSLLYPWTTTLESVGFVWDYILEHYMTRPNYWRVDGLPYFSIYSVNRFIIQMGGVEAAASALQLLRDKAKAAGLPGVHINGVWRDNLDLEPNCVCSQEDWYTTVGFSSYTSYNNAYTSPIWEESFPKVDFAGATEGYLKVVRKALEILPAPYYPVVTAGWDSSPRTIQSETYRYSMYPFLTIMEPSPEALAEELLNLAGILQKRPSADRIIFLNAWNEWTEGSYLEPDTKNGYSLLEKLKEFKER